MPHTPSRLSRRSALRLLVSASGVALLAACQAPTPATPATSAPAPKPTLPAAAHSPRLPRPRPRAPLPVPDRPTQAGFLPVGVSQSAATP